MKKLMNSKIIELIEKLKEKYPEAKCSLDFNSPFELVVAVMLSAQCTDERVNKVTPILFEKLKTPEDFEKANIETIEKLIHSCGFYKNKAKNLKKCAYQIIHNFNGEVPCTMEELTTLAGIGRKSANVILLEVFGIAEGIAVDTHAKRLSNRIGLSKSSIPEKVEQDLLKVIPKEYLKDVNHLFVYHGRNMCLARKPKCLECPISILCEYFSENYCKK